jgi:hypothetical protein
MLHNRNHQRRAASLRSRETVRQALCGGLDWFGQTYSPTIRDVLQERDSPNAAETYLPPVSLWLLEAVKRWCARCRLTVTLRRLVVDLEPEIFHPFIHKPFIHSH